MPTRVRRVTGEPVNDADLAFLAMDTGRVPVQFAAVLVLDKDVDPSRVERLLTRRVQPVERLRRRVAARGRFRRPVWEVADGFRVADHLLVLSCPAPGDDTALMTLATDLVLRPLPPDRPLWRVAVVNGLATGAGALVFVVHHVIADGINGLAILTALADDTGRDDVAPAPGVAGARPPRRPAGPVRRTAARLYRLSTATSAAGGLAPARAQPCSLLGSVGPTRRAAVVTVALSGLRATAHRNGVTVHTALLVAVANTLHRILDHRGETVRSVVMAVPVAGEHGGPGSPGTVASPMLVTVAADGSVEEKLRAVAEAVRRRRARAAGPAPVALLGRPFRLFARLGGYRW